MGAVPELAARALVASGFLHVFGAPMSALYRAEPIVLTEGAFERKARLEDSLELGYVVIEVST